MADTRRLKASDAERDACVAHLRKAMVDGRLELDEFERRLERAIAAEAVVDLADLVYDLPVPRSAFIGEPEKRRRSLAERAARLEST